MPELKNPRRERFPARRLGRFRADTCTLGTGRNDDAKLYIRHRAMDGNEGHHLCGETTLFMRKPAKLCFCD